MFVLGMQEVMHFYEVEFGTFEIVVNMSCKLALFFSFNFNYIL